MPSQESAIQSGPRRVALIGNPNTGKSTLFNALTGMKARVANFPGCTVEKKTGRLHFDGRLVELIDLPGTYSLSPRTLDEMVTVDVLLGRRKDVGPVDAVVCIVDASNLERNLYLLSQILDFGLPTILVLNMWDISQARQVSIDVEGLRQQLGIPVIVCEAHRRMGTEDVRGAIVHASTVKRPARPEPFPTAFYEECGHLKEWLATRNDEPDSACIIERLLIDVGGQIEQQFLDRHGDALTALLSEARARLASAGCRLPIAEAHVRYAWVRGVLSGLVSVSKQRMRTRSDSVDRFLTHRVTGLLAFALLMFVVFQALYSWSGPLMAVVEAAQSLVVDRVVDAMPPGPVRSLVVDGVIAGVGGVLIFLPQIAMLFLFIAILEDCGYLARAAFVMDRLMTSIGLSGKSFVPLMSSFACAIPGVMATRVIENRRDRFITILIAPLMSCSARLPVYVLMTTAFVPPIAYFDGLVGLRGLVLFAMSSLGALVAIPTAWLLKKTCFPGETPPFIMELPSYKFPSIRIVLGRVVDRSRAFVLRAGTLIFATTILVWAAGYFPADHTELHKLEAQIEEGERDSERLEGSQDHQALRAVSARLASLSEDRNQLAGTLIEHSYLGIAGRTIEPAVRPLGWDWKIGVGVLASFPAREVIIATLGTIYSLGSDIDESDAGLIETLRQAKHPDGKTPVFNVVVAFSIMVFFALCAQCASTLMVIRRETSSWLWPLFTFAYMTTLAYIGSLVTYQLGMLLLA